MLKFLVEVNLRVQIANIFIDDILIVSCQMEGRIASITGGRKLESSQPISFFPGFAKHVEMTVVYDFMNRD